MLLGIVIGLVGSFVAQIIGMAIWWYRMVKRAGEKPLAALHKDFAEVRGSIRRVKS